MIHLLLYMYTYLQAINDCKVIDSFSNTLVIRPILLLLELNQLPIHIEKLPHYKADVAYGNPNVFASIYVD